MFSQNDLESIILSLLKKYHAEGAILFGSYARKEAGISSDIDLLIIGGASFEPTDVFALAEDLHRATGKNVDVYESGPAAKNYILPEDYKARGIGLAWKNYDGYPAYPQQSEFFIHQVSVIDVLFNTGEDASYYIWGWRKDSDIPSCITE